MNGQLLAHLNKEKRNRIVLKLMMRIPLSLILVILEIHVRLGYDQHFTSKSGHNSKKFWKSL